MTKVIYHRSQNPPLYISTSSPPPGGGCGKPSSPSAGGGAGGGVPPAGAELNEVEPEAPIIAGTAGRYAGAMHSKDCNGLPSK